MLEDQPGGDAYRERGAARAWPPARSCSRRPTRRSSPRARRRPISSSRARACVPTIPRSSPRRWRACRCGPRSTLAVERLRGPHAAAAPRRGHRHQRQDHRHHADRGDAARSPASAAPRPATSGAHCIDATDDDVDVVVAEVSSFQLEFTTDAFVPDVAVLLNVAAGPPRLARHGRGLRRRQGARLRPPGPDDVLVVNRDDPVAWDLAQSRAPAQVVPLRTRCAGTRRLRRRRRRARRAGRACSRRCRRSGAAHDIDNALAAAAAALRAGADASAVARTLARLDGAAPSRAVRRRRRRGAVRRRLEGDERARDGERARGLRARRADRRWPQQGPRPRAAPEVRAAVARGRRDRRGHREVEAVVRRALAPVERATSMHRRGAHRGRRARSPATWCCCRPACASFDWYESYAARGDDFAREVDAAGQGRRGSHEHGRRTPYRQRRAQLGRARRRRPHAPRRRPRARPREAARRTRATTRSSSTVMLLATTVAVLNVVGVVMVLSASSVASLTDYGSPWYFFLRQLLWSVRRRRRVRRRDPLRLPPLATVRPPAADRQRGAARRSCSSRASACTSPARGAGSARGCSASSRPSWPSSRCCSTPPISPAAARARSTTGDASSSPCSSCSAGSASS